MSFISDRVKKREDSISDIKVIPFYREEKISAILWYGVTGCYGTILDNKLKGVRIRQGNMLIGDKGTCNGLFKEERFNGWMIGELHVFDNDLIVNARRDYFEQNEAHYDLSETFKEWSASKAKEIRKISYERTLSGKRKAVVNATDPDDVNDLFVEDFDSYGSRPFELAELKLFVDAVSSSQFISVKKSQELIEKLCSLTSVYEAEKLISRVYRV